MKKTELLVRVHDAHEKLTNALDRLTEEEANGIGLNPQWSVKDALSHVVAWEKEGARIVTEIQNGTWTPQRLDKQVIDDFNARAVEDRKNFSMPEVRAEFDAAHKEMERVIDSLPFEVEESSPAYKFVEGVTFRHHTHHAAQIEDWKQKGNQK